MVRKVNIISQRLFLNLLPNHKNSILYFNYFFRYKVFLDCILVNFLKKFRNIFLVDFYLGYSKSSFYLNLFIFFYKKDCIVDKFSQVRQLKGNLYLNCFVNNLFKSFYNLKNLSIFLGLVTKLRKIDFFLPFLFYSLKPNSLFFNTLLFSKLKNFEFWKSFNLTKLNYVVYTNYYFLKNYWYLNLLKLEKITFFKDEFFVKKLSKKLFSIKNSFLKKLFFWWIKQKSNFFLTNNFFFNPLKTKIIKSNKKFNFLKYYFKKFNFFFSRIFFKKYLFGHDLNSLFFTYKLFYKFKLLFKQRLYLKFFNLKKKPKKNLKTKVLSFQSNLIFFHFNKTFNKKKIKLVKTFKISEFLNNYFKNFYILKNSKKLKKFIFYFNKNKFFKKNDNFKLYASLVKRYGRLKKKNSKLHSNVFLPFLYFSFLKFNSGVTFKSFIYFKNNILNFSFKKFNKCHLLNNFFF